MAPGTTTVLSYYDSCLTADDVELLEERHWLNDKLIGFWFEYLEHTVLNGCDDVVLVTPAVTQMMKFASAELLEDVLAPLKLPSRSVAIFAVNDNSSDTVAGGAHWSLLCYSRVINSFFHYDSLDGAPNSEGAAGLERIMADMLRCPSEPRHIEVKCPLQENMSDCGMYVIFYAEHVATEYKKQLIGDTSVENMWDMQGIVQTPLPSEIVEKRVAMKRCIERLAGEDDLPPS